MQEGTWKTSNTVTGEEVEIWHHAGGCQKARQNEEKRGVPEKENPKLVSGLALPNSQDCLKDDEKSELFLSINTVAL